METLDRGSNKTSANLTTNRSHRHSKNGANNRKRENKNKTKKSNASLGDKQKTPKKSDQFTYQELGLKSPPMSKHRIDSKTALKLIKADGLRKYIPRVKTDATDESRCLIFLYGRGFLANLTKKDRVEVVEKMISKTKLKRKDQHIPLDILTRVVYSKEGDYNCDTVKDRYMYEYNKRILLKLEGYNRLDDIKLYLRTQSCGNCYLIAACIFVCQLTRFRGCEMDPIDVCKYVRHSYTDSQLQTLVIKDAGGNSQEVAEQILKKMTGKKLTLNRYDVKHFFDNNMAERLVEEIELCGPALVSDFKVPNGFGGQDGTEIHRKSKGLEFGIRQYRSAGQQRQREGDYWKLGDIEKIEQKFGIDKTEIQKEQLRSRSDERTIHTSNEGRPVVGNVSTEGAVDERHAMVILDAKKIKSNDRKKDYDCWFLVQNWWPGSQLQEVNAKYFAQTEATIFCCPMYKSMSFSSSNVYSKNSAPVAHCHNLDRAHTQVDFNDDDCYDNDGYFPG